MTTNPVNLLEVEDLRIAFAGKEVVHGVNFTLANVGLLVFPVVILGGLGSILGAIVGGLAIGLLQNAASAYLDPCVGGGLKNVFPFFALIAIGDKLGLYRAVAGAGEGWSSFRGSAAGAA